MKCTVEVATVLTACGIETTMSPPSLPSMPKLQQCLPLAVLKRLKRPRCIEHINGCNSAYRLRYWNDLDIQLQSYDIKLVATVLTACGIETGEANFHFTGIHVATVLTACGIETRYRKRRIFLNLKLQQCLPLAVLKRGEVNEQRPSCGKLQQCLPLAVLKQRPGLDNRPGCCRRGCNSAYRLRYWNSSKDVTFSATIQSVATVLTACGIETLPNVQQNVDEPLRSCNSAYRLRYATKGARQQRSEATMRTAHL